MMKKSSLGTGLSSLIPDKAKKTEVNEKKTEKTNKDGEVIELSVDSIKPNPSQPRYYFDENNLKNLADSIKKYGVVQPIIVTQLEKGKYELIAGERRLRASKLIGNAKIPAIIRKASSIEKLELAIIENIQRHDLNPIEEAKAYKRLKDEFSLTQEEVATKLGKNRATIANTMRLLDLPVEIQRGLIEKKITEGHARAILSLDNPEKQRVLYELIIKGGLTVRDAENKVKEVTVPSHKRKINNDIDPHLQDMESRFQQALGTKVQLKKKNGSGRIVIDFFSDEEFDKIKNIFLSGL